MRSSAAIMLLVLVGCDPLAQQPVTPTLPIAPAGEGNIADGGTFDAGLNAGDDSGVPPGDGGDECGCAPPSRCNRGFTGCTLECSPCDSQLACAGDGMCRIVFAGFAGYCSYPVASCGGGPVPATADIVVRQEECPGQGPGEFRCSLHHSVVADGGAVRLRFVREDRSTGAVVMRDFGSFTSQTTNEALLAAGRDAGLWCVTLPPPWETCATHQPFVTVNVSAADAGHSFEYNLGIGVRPPLPVARLVDTVLTEARPFWRDGGLEFY